MLQIGYKVLGQSRSGTANLNFIEQGKEIFTSKGKGFSSKGREGLVKPQVLTMLSELILAGKPPASLLALSSVMIAVYLRFYQFSFTLVRLLQ